MTGDEYRDLAAMWNASAEESDRRTLARLARRTPRVARLVLWGELSVVLLLAVTILLAIVWKLGLATLLIGGLVLLVLGWSARKRYYLGNIALLVDERDRLSFLRSSVRAREAELNRSAVGLALILPSTLLTMLLGFTLRGEERQGELAAFLAAVLTTPRGLIALGFLLCAVLLLILSHVRLTNELKRLRQLRDDYANEAELDRFLGG